MKTRFSRKSIIRRGAGIIVALCLSLTGCSDALRDAESAVKETVTFVKDKVGEVTGLYSTDREFTRIPTPEDKAVYTADMLDSDTVLIMAEGDYSDEFRIMKYSVENGKLVSICSGTLLKNSETDGYYMITLCVDPLVVADVKQNVVYAFSGDYMTINTVTLDSLDALSYKYSPSRSALIYAVSNDNACELREYSFAEGVSAVLMDMSRDYGYIWLDELFDDQHTAVLTGRRLFGDEDRTIFVDLADFTIIGETENGNKYDQGPYNLSVVSTDENRCEIAGIKTDDGLISTLTNLNGESTDLKSWSLDTSNVVCQLVEDGNVVAFASSGDGKCVVEMYSADGGLQNYGSFTVGEFTTSVMENELHPRNAADVSDEPLSVYLTASDVNACEGGYMVFVLGTGERIGSVVLWDATWREVDATLPNYGELTFTLTAVTDEGYSDANTAYANSIEDSYGVTICYGGDADVDFVDYDAEPEYDESNIRRGLDALKDALELFPEGFFRDMMNGDMRHINIYFCSELIPQGDNSIESAAAFTYMLHGNAIVVMNTDDNNSVFGSFCHEFMHVIDYRLSAAGLMDEDTWSGFNPDGFTYFDSYKDENGRDLELAADARYTSGDSDYTRTGDAEYVWFVDAYATTYPTEDRARLFEFAMRYNDDLPKFYRSSHVQAKLTYLFDLIRQCWDDSEWPEVTVWERALR